MRRYYKKYSRRRKNSVPTVQKKNLLQNKWTWIIAVIVIAVVFFKKQLNSLLSPFTSSGDAISGAVDSVADFLGIGSKKKQDVEVMNETIKKLEGHGVLSAVCYDSLSNPPVEIKTFDSDFVARSIYGHIHWYGNNWAGIMGDFKYCSDWLRVSKVFKSYRAIYGEDLLAVFQHGFIGLVDNESLGKLIMYIDSLPYLD